MLNDQSNLHHAGRKDVTLRKLDNIKVETVNREPLTLHTDREEDTASVSTATRVMKSIYSVRNNLSSTPSICQPNTIFNWLGRARCLAYGRFNPYCL